MSRTIATVEGDVSIMGNVYDDLRYLRLSDYPCSTAGPFSSGVLGLPPAGGFVLVWADAICINQNDNEEKAR